MAQVRFLDDEHASTTTTVDDQLLADGDSRDMCAASLALSAALFQDRTIVTGSRRGTPYYSKEVDRSQWAHPDIQEWAAATDEDPGKDN